jgi:hypothetical protein
MEYYYFITKGWFTKNDEQVPCPKTLCVEPNPYAEYHIFAYEAIWRLHKDSESGQYLVSEMKAYPELKNAVYTLWVIPTDELAELMLEFIRDQDSRT